MTAEEVMEALKRPPCLMIYDHPHKAELFKTWSLGPIIRSAQETLIQQSNGIALVRHLESDPSLEDDWCLWDAKHFAVGPVTHLSFRVGNAPTKDIAEQERTVDRLEERARNYRYDENWDMADYWEGEAERAKEHLEKLVQGTDHVSRIFRVLQEWDRQAKDIAPIRDLKIYHECKEEAVRGSIEHTLRYDFELLEGVDLDQTIDRVYLAIGGWSATCDQYGNPHGVDYEYFLRQIGAIE